SVDRTRTRGDAPQSYPPTPVLRPALLVLCQYVLFYHTPPPVDQENVAGAPLLQLPDTPQYPGIPARCTRLPALAQQVPSPATPWPKPRGRETPAGVQGLDWLPPARTPPGSLACTDRA